ncbi:MAG: hypothetical protein ACI909_001463 [Planctomycetota bacterium]|jgi:hypothetical protein
MHIPFWLKLSLVICLAILIGTWFAGESTRKLHSEYILNSIRNDMQRTTGLLAGLIAESVVIGDTRKTESIIKQYAAGWSEFTYIHVLDDHGMYVTDWQKHPIKFGQNTRKFEQAIVHGNQEFGILSVYVDMGSFFEAMNQHIKTSRRQAALILLSLTMFIVFFINFFALKETQADSVSNGK